MRRLILAGCALWVCGRLAAQERPLVLTIQVRPGASAQTLETIAKIGEANEVVTFERVTIKSLLSDEYGFSHDRFRDLFNKYNPALKSELIRPKTHVTLPAAPIWMFDVKKKTTGDLSALDLAKIEMGQYGTKTRKRIAEKNNTKPDLVDTIKGGKQVILPYVVPFVSIEIKPEFREVAAAMVRKMKAADEAVIHAEVDEPFQLIGPLASSPSVTGSAQIYTRPMPDAAFLSRLPKIRSTIAVIDSGLAENDPRFDDLWKNARLGPDGNDLDFPYMSGTLHGYDFVGEKAFPADDAVNHHGTHVAGIASQRLVAGIRAAVNERIDLMILKVADTEGNVYQGFVNNAVGFAVQRQVRVANMSFAGKGSSGLQMAVTNAPSVLFVAAAGNDAIDADGNEKRVYPAKLACHVPNVISVAAIEHRLDGAGNPRHGNAERSSQAAPLVAYVAALLAGNFDSGEDLRNRIIDSADVQPALYGKVASEGALDPEKALSFSTDVVELADHTLLRGKLLAPERMTLTTGPSVETKQITKIVFDYSKHPGAGFRITWTDGKKRSTDEALRSLGEITFAHDGREEKIPVTNLRDFVRASLPVHP
jgi:hypothetical protein